MSDVDFFADLMATGTALGVDHTSGLAAVEEVFGSGRTAQVSASAMLSDFGLIEFGWNRGGPRDDWAVTWFGAQAHRLSWLVPENLVEQALLSRHGGFRPRVDFDELRAAVQARGFSLEPRPSPNDDCVEFWEPTSRMGVIVSSEPDGSGWGPAGTVLKMLGPQRGSAWNRFQGRRETFNSYATHLLALSDAERAAWLDKREPEADPERGDWWSCLRSVIARRVGGGPAVAVEWWRLRIALDRHAAVRGVDAPDEAAVTLGVAILGAEDLGIADEVPTMDEVMARWLGATAATLASARRLCTERPLDAAGVRLSRRLRNQIHDIEPCLPHVTSAVLADELRDWIDLKPELLRLPFQVQTLQGWSA
jgi:hypothetical protein